MERMSDEDLERGLAALQAMRAPEELRRRMQGLLGLRPEPTAAQRAGAWLGALWARPAFRPALTAACLLLGLAAWQWRCSSPAAAVPLDMASLKVQAEDMDFSSLADEIEAQQHEDTLASLSRGLKLGAEDGAGGI